MSGKFKHNRLMISSENKICIKYKFLRWRIKESIGLVIVNLKGVVNGRLKKVKHINVEDDII